MTTITLPVAVVRALCDLAALTEDRSEIESHALEAALASLDAVNHATRVEKLTS